MEREQGTWELIGEISVDRVEAVPLQNVTLDDTTSSEATLPTIVDFLRCPVCPSRFQLENQLLTHIQNQHLEPVIKVEHFSNDSSDSSNSNKRLKSMQIPLTISTEKLALAQAEPKEEGMEISRNPVPEEQSNSRNRDREVVEAQEMDTNESASVEDGEVHEMSNATLTKQKNRIKSMPDHVKRFTSDEGMTSFVCAHCAYRVAEESTMLLQHTPHHLSKEVHSCHACSFSARAPEVLLSHIEDVHSVLAHARLVEQSPSKCRHCPFRTAFVQDLSKHMLHHVDTFRYHCSLCSFCAQDQKSVVLHEGIHFVKQLAPFQGIVRPTRKYQKPGDKTPFFLANDIVTHRPVSKRPPLTEQQKSDLRQSLLKAGLNPTIIC